MYNALYKYLSISCLLVSGVYANQVSADWYSNDPQLNQQQGFGDFPPLTIDQDLDQQQKQMESSPIDSEPQQYQDSNPWDNGTAPVDHTPRQQAAPQVRVQPPVSIQPEVERKTSPLGNIYQPDPYPAPGYGTYNPGLIARPYAGSGRGVGGPWNNNRGSGFQGPWNNNGSSFSPWGGRNGSGNGISPFGMSSPGGWFE